MGPLTRTSAEHYSPADTTESAYLSHRDDVSVPVKRERMLMHCDVPHFVFYRRLSKAQIPPSAVFKIAPNQGRARLTLLFPSSQSCEDPSTGEALEDHPRSITTISSWVAPR